MQIQLAIFCTLLALTVALPARKLVRNGTEILVCGELYDIGTRVVLYGDVGGYDAYRTERRFWRLNESDWDHTHAWDPVIFNVPNRYGIRTNGLNPDQVEKIRGGQWDLPTLQTLVNKFVLHYDVTGFAKETFRILHDVRDLSVQFILDIDGTLYQTLDVKDKAYHAGVANTNSIGIEIANIGAYPIGGANPFDKFYKNTLQPDTQKNRTSLINPANSGVLTKDFIGYPARNDKISGMIQGAMYEMYDFTPQQYQALAKLLAAHAQLFPAIKLDAPRDGNGKVITTVMTPTDFSAFHGVVGHWHVNVDKIDPGPALNWDWLFGEARKILNATETQPEPVQLCDDIPLSPGGIAGVALLTAAIGFSVALLLVSFTPLGAKLVNNRGVKLGTRASGSGDTPLAADDRA